MKKGYKRLLVLISSLMILLFINSFTLILSGYTMILFLIIILIGFNIYFVLEKDNHRYFKDILFEILLFFAFFFILYYILGLVVGLTKTQNYFSINGIRDFLLPIPIYIILREVFRYNLLCKADGNKLCTVLVIILMVLFDITDDFYYTDFSTKYNIFKFLALALLPAISKSISYSYISKQMGYKPTIIFDLIFVLYPYIIPIIPNPNEYIVSIIYLLIPIVFAFRILKFFEAKEDDMIPSDYHKKKFKGILLPFFVVATLIYFYSGYFRYYAIAIASGSMQPEINKGDIVIVDQKYTHNKIEIGDVIATKRESIIIVHRVVKKVKINNSYLYYTQGDANSKIDDFVIEKDMIIGKVKMKIPYIGYPTVWFNKE